MEVLVKILVLLMPLCWGLLLGSYLLDFEDWIYRRRVERLWMLAQISRLSDEVRRNRR